MDAESAAGIFKAAAAEHYDRHVGRYTRELARSLMAHAGVRPGQSALDVGCGPGALATELAAILGPDSVCAVDPSPSFVEACRQRLPGMDVRVAVAEQLPFDDDSFDHSLAQLVVNFMANAIAGVSDMARVTRPGGRVSAATWDYADGMTFLRHFWDAALAVDPAAAVVDEGLTMRYCTPDELGTLLSDSGLTDVRVSSAQPSAMYENFADLWTPIEGSIGPSGVYVASLPDDRRAALRIEFQRLLGIGDAPFSLSARAWIASGVVPRPPA